MQKVKYIKLIVLICEFIFTSILIIFYKLNYLYN